MNGRVLGVLGLCAVGLTGLPGRAADNAESHALAEIARQRTEGLIAVQPWAQLLGAGQLGVGWLTSGPADGIVEWSQDDPGGTGAVWRVAWYSEDGLRQAHGTAQRAVISGYDCTKPIRFRARSRPIDAFKPYKVTFGAAVTSDVRRLPPLVSADGRVAFAVFNDIHSRVGLYPQLMARVPNSVGFAILNGDVLQDPGTAGELVDNLLLPMAWFTARAIPCFFLRGNHETRGAFARHMKAFMALPANRYYGAMTVGPVRLLLLDSGEDKPDASPEYSGLVEFDAYIEEELAWLRQEVARPEHRQAAWRVAVVHIPPDWRKAESTLWHGERRMRERFAPLFDEGRIDVVISGHNHKAEIVEPCPDVRRGFRWPVFIGGSHPLANATVIIAEATPATLAVTCRRADGTVVAERKWSK